MSDYYTPVETVYAMDFEITYADGSSERVESFSDAKKLVQAELAAKYKQANVRVCIDRLSERVWVMWCEGGSGMFSRVLEEVTISDMD